MNQLSRLERWIEQLVEEPFVRFFAGRLLPQDVVRHLVRALEDVERLGADGTPEVPGRYRIDLHPADLNALRRHHPDIEIRLAEALKSLVSRMDIRLREPPEVKLQPNDHLQPRGVSITAAERMAHDADGTQDLETARLEQMFERTQAATRPNAYLIIQGDRTVDLTSPTITIGRALDNDVILEDRHISRYHARLRQRYGKYILQDLGSRGGTMVNGFSVQEIVLRPGDLISLSGVDVIYAESEPLQRDHQQSGGTRSMPPIEG